MLLRAACVLVLFGILVAGLWPFHSPRNEVSWLTHKNGLHFGKYGSIVSAGPFKAHPPQADSSCGLEIWLEPRRVQASGTILAFYWPESQVVPFALRQSLGDLELLRRSRNDDPSHDGKRAKLYVDDLFLSHQQPVLVTINAGQSGTTIYADGALVKKAPNFKFSSQELTGQLVIGNAPATTDEWSGQVSGLAIYDRELTADEVSKHYESWTNDKPAGLAGSDGAVALYLFNEAEGNVVHNHVDAATDLLIPERFFVLHQEFLERPWNEYRPDWNYWEDVGINVAGFIPLGFLFYAYFSAGRETKRAVAITIAFGFAVSLTIEVSQAFLPTRDSGMTDLITNTFGTALGAILFAWIATHQWLARAGIKIPFLAKETREVRELAE
jgi:VanZ family protein